MAAILNPVVNVFVTDETDLMQSLISEAIQLKGIQVSYMPRTLVNDDLLYGEDAVSTFNSATNIEVYLKDIETTGDDFASRFGLQLNDRATFVMAKDRAATEGITPKEGDLIYMPLHATTYEVLFVEDEPQFYMLEKQYSYELICEVFNYSHEKFDTGNTTIDAVETSTTYRIQIPVGSGNATNFLVGEPVYQGANLGSSTFSAEVASWTTSPDVLEVINTKGTITASTNVVGDTSGAIWLYSTGVDETDNVNDPGDRNKEIEIEAGTVIDYSESDPFGEF